MHDVFLTIVLVIVTDSSGELPRGFSYQRVQSSELNCAQVMDQEEEIMSLYGYEADQYCLYQFSSPRPTARPAG